MQIYTRDPNEEDVELALWARRYELEREVRASRTDLDLWEYLTKLAVLTAVVFLAYTYNLVPGGQLVVGVLLTIIWHETGKDMIRAILGWMDRHPLFMFVVASVAFVILPILAWFAAYGAMGGLLKLTYILMGEASL
jgi:hypothetical protein